MIESQGSIASGFFASKQTGSFAMLLA